MWWMARAGLLAAFGIMLFGTPARADDLAGRWLNVGSTFAGRYASYITFDGNGGVLEDVQIAAAPGAGGSGMTRCQGRYGFDGQTLTMQWGGCMTCPAGGGCMPSPPTYMPTGGPVAILGPGIITIGGDRFTRQ